MRELRDFLNRRGLSGAAPILRHAREAPSRPVRRGVGAARAAARLRTPRSDSRSTAPARARARPAWPTRSSPSPTTAPRPPGTRRAWPSSASRSSRSSTSSASAASTSPALRSPRRERSPTRPPSYGVRRTPPSTSRAPRCRSRRGQAGHGAGRAGTASTSSRARLRADIDARASLPTARPRPPCVEDRPDGRHRRPLGGRRRQADRSTSPSAAAWTSGVATGPSGSAGRDPGAGRPAAFFSSYADGQLRGDQRSRGLLLTYPGLERRPRLPSAVLVVLRFDGERLVARRAVGRERRPRPFPASALDRGGARAAARSALDGRRGPDARRVDGRARGGHPRGAGPGQLLRRAAARAHHHARHASR